MHGGKSHGPKTRIGKKRSRMAAFRHGGYTMHAKAELDKARELIKRSKDVLKSFQY